MIVDMDHEWSSGLRLQIHVLHRSSDEHLSPSTDTSSPLRSAAASLSPSPSPAWSFFIVVQVFDRLLLFKIVIAVDKETLDMLTTLGMGDIPGVRLDSTEL
ncbi:hypothetical protein ACLB2K_029538 [Fragaria x ananassa]